MENEITKNIEEYAANLPPELKEKINSGWETSLKSLARKYLLSEEESITLEDEISVILFGLESVDEAREELQKKLSLRTADLDALMIEIRQQILFDIMPVLEKLHSNEKDREEIPTEKTAGVEIEEIKRLEDTKESFDREAIMHGIEEPLRIDPANEIKPAPKIHPIDAPTPTKPQNNNDDLVSRKLAGINTPSTPPEKRGYAAGQDPYREPIN